MNSDLFQYELKERLKEIDDFSIEIISTKDFLSLVATGKNGIVLCIKDYHNVKINVPNYDTLSYEMDAAADINKKIQFGNIGNSVFPKLVEPYIEIIDEVNKAAINYDRACMLYNQYMSNRSMNLSLLQKAQNYLNVVNWHFKPALELIKAINCEALKQNILLS